MKIGKQAGVCLWENTFLAQDVRIACSDIDQNLFFKMLLLRNANTYLHYSLKIMSLILLLDTSSSRIKEVCNKVNVQSLGKQSSLSLQKNILIFL